MAQELKTDLVSPADGSSGLPRMTYEEFLDWYDEQHAEWVDGEVILLASPSKGHQLLLSFLGALLQHFVEAHDLGTVLIAPFQMKLASRPSGCEPDILVLCPETLAKLTSRYLDGPADVAIEIISPDSRSRDRGDKYYEYEQAGVREYWLIDPIRKQAEFYRLGQEGIYALVSPGSDGIFHSAVLEGLRLRVEWLWQEPLPTLMTVLKEWELVT
jgi:Uma2 family endonuclease